MEFTYESYGKLFDLLSENGYRPVNYHNWLNNTILESDSLLISNAEVGGQRVDRKYIIRHDVDYSLSKAVEMAEFEAKRGIRATYFIMVSNDFYNIFSIESTKDINKISEYGHDICLHFDEMKYPDFNLSELKQMIIKECNILSCVLDNPICSVSMHRPSEKMLASNLEIDGIVNTYGKVYFEEFKYVSDSRRRWREPIEEYVKSKKFDKFQILIHPFWYFEEEKSLHDTIYEFVNGANGERYQMLADNFSSLNEVMGEEETVNDFIGN